MEEHPYAWYFDHTQRLTLPYKLWRITLLPIYTWNPAPDPSHEWHFIDGESLFHRARSELVKFLMEKFQLYNLANHIH